MIVWGVPHDCGCVESGQRMAPEGRTKSRVSEAVSTTTSSSDSDGKFRIQVDQVKSQESKSLFAGEFLVHVCINSTIVS